MYVTPYSLYQKDNHFANFKEMLSEFEKTLRHDDFSYTTEICTSPLWMDTMLTSLQHMEANRYRCDVVQAPTVVCDIRYTDKLISTLTDCRIKFNQIVWNARVRYCMDLIF